MMMTVRRWEALECDKESMLEVCKVIMDLYSKPKARCPDTKAIPANGDGSVKSKKAIASLIAAPKIEEEAVS